eukprot:s47_g67.t1
MSKALEEMYVEAPLTLHHVFSMIFFNLGLRMLPSRSTLGGCPYGTEQENTIRIHLASAARALARAAGPAPPPLGQWLC